MLIRRSLVRLGLAGLLTAGLSACAATVKAPAPPEPAAPVAVAENVQSLPIVTIETTKGTIKAVLYTDKAPITATNFIALAKRHFYDGLTWHRVVPGFVIQGGDPTGTGDGGSDKTIPLEIGKGLSHDAAGVFGMARDSDPNSASSQFYITQAAVTRLDGKYAVFGKVIEGLDVVMAIKVGDRMTKVTVAP
jgi:cyclophilin family peptidyl-prolyl cis-trans isomerase